MNDMTGRIAMVTGGSRGIGAAVARGLAAAGADIVLTYQHESDRAAAVVDEIENMGRRATAIQADSHDVDALTAAVDQTAASFGGMDILVNNASAFVVASIDDLSVADFDRAVAVNVRAPFVAAQAATRHMTNGGRIISIGSNMAVRTVFPGFSMYALSKAALVGMTKGLARDLGPRGVTVNLVHPGPTDTDANPADGPNSEAIRSHTALDRYATPDEIAAAVVFLASDAAGYITGATVAVDGGFTI